MPCAYISCDELDLFGNSSSVITPFVPDGARGNAYLFSCTSPVCLAADPSPDPGGTGRHFEYPNDPGTITVTQMPEPSTLLLFGAALLGAVALARLRPKPERG